LHLGAGNLFGGIEVNLLTLARFRDGCPELDAEYGFCFGGKPANELRKLNAVVHTFGAVRYSRPWTVLAARRRLAQTLRRNAYDVVICHETWVHGLFAPVVRAARLPLVFWAHDQHAGDNSWLEWLARRNRPDRVICNSRYSAETMPRFWPGVHCDVIYCPVAPLPKPAGDVRSNFRQRLGTEANSVVIIQVGRWEPHKGHIAHIEALARLRTIAGWECWQVGAPQRPEEQAYCDRVRALAQEHGISQRVRFLGWQADLGAVLAAADIYCQPNIRPEPFGITLVEALYAGLPVVAANEAGPQEIVTEDCGILVDARDGSSLADSLHRLIRNTAERCAAKEFGPARAAELCGPRHQVQKMAAVLSMGRIHASV
jgi:glycosyltransferase involved in cell wall biosynthesis